MKEAFARQSVSILSPLRYPGAKRRLAGYIAEVIKLNDLKPKLFVEPFAGGASVSLQLLNNNIVEKIALGEIDPLVSAFWKVVFFDSEWLIAQIDSIDITVEQWDFFKNTKFRSNREKALACIFLNRTSFSGILASTAGPLGGRSQKSIYPIDCRFPRDTIKKRIYQAARLKDRVSFISNSDWIKTIEKAELMKYKKGEVFYYLDPPFYYKADRLYRYFFDEEDHLRLRDYPEGTLFSWVVSDFSLIDAIESGIVKVPRVPVSDDQLDDDMPTYRKLWYRIRDHLPKKGRGTLALSGDPVLPTELEGAIHSPRQLFLLWWPDRTVLSSRECSSSIIGKADWRNCLGLSKAFNSENRLTWIQYPRKNEAGTCPVFAAKTQNQR